MITFKHDDRPAMKVAVELPDGAYRSIRGDSGVQVILKRGTAIGYIYTDGSFYMQTLGTSLRVDWEPCDLHIITSTRK